jgi:hypothetical protein
MALNLHIGFSSPKVALRPRVFPTVKVVTLREMGLFVGLAKRRLEKLWLMDCHLFTRVFGDFALFLQLIVPRRMI